MKKEKHDSFYEMVRSFDWLINTKNANHVDTNQERERESGEKNEIITYLF